MFTNKPLQIIIISIIIVLIIGYLFGITLNKIPLNNRLGVAEISLIVILLLIFTGFFSNISELSFGPFSTKLKEFKQVQDKQTNDLNEQKNEIQLIKFLLQSLIPENEKDKLRGLSQIDPFMCWFSQDLYDETKHLDSLKFLEIMPENKKGLNAIYDYKDKNAQLDLKQIVRITKKGLDYLKVLDEVDKTENIGS
jgi:energy-coupling factor transporter transmembrane protein EcfT